MSARASTRSDADAIEVTALAKINLTLRVLGTRADGYHDLRTVFQSVALCDRLTFRRVRGPFRITSDDPDCPVDRGNLVWRAADYVWREARRRGRPSGVHVHIRKGIPVRAGLGGGSSDGAAALRALAALWRVDIDAVRLAAIGARLGADVPFFLIGGTALGVERGDRVFALQDHPAAWVVVARPPVGVATKEAYAWLDADRARSIRGSSQMRMDGPFGDGGNDFQPVVERRHPVVGRLTRALRRAGASWAAMSGSGSAVYGLFANRADAVNAARPLAAAGCATHVTRTLSARQYVARAALRRPGLAR